MNPRTASPDITNGAADTPTDLPRKNRHVLLGRVFSALVLLVVLILLVGFVLSPAVDWNVVWQYIFDPLILRGAVNTLTLTFWSVAIALFLAVLVALMALSSHVVIRAVATAYVWFFRSVPLLVLLILWFNIAIVIPRIVIGVPFGPEFWSVDTSSIIDAYWAAVAAFAIHQAAYMSEVIRAALLAVPAGQREAATALGMRQRQRFWLVSLPQALRIAIPPLGNDVIGLLKGTSLAAFVAVPDLLYSAQAIYNRNYEIFPLLIVATIWYLLFVTILTIGQHSVEKRLREGKRGRAMATLTTKAAITSEL